MSKHTDKPVEVDQNKPAAQLWDEKHERPHNDHLADYLNDAITRWMRRHKDRKPVAVASFDETNNVILVDMTLDGATVASASATTLTQALMQNAIQDELER